MTLRIIVFNHSQNHLLLYKTILSTRGYQVFTYQQDMTEFLEVEGVQPALIILGNVVGLYEPELDILDQIRSHAETHDVPVLIVTTATEEMLDSERLRSLGNIYTLSKPFNALHLLDAVNRALNPSQYENVTQH